jgi:acyl-coenzyme A thioesterase PaaI-like protein
MLESVVTLPFNQHIGIQKSETSDGLLELPAGNQFLNHIGTVHACAQLALAEACSGEFLLQSLSGQLVGILPVVRRVEAKFRKPANGKLLASKRL